MTPDGISAEDWEKVFQVARSLTNALLREEVDLVLNCQSQLGEVLDELESRYGRLPSILATRADFSECPEEAMLLLQEALQIATDQLSIRLALQSLVSLQLTAGCRRESIAENFVWLGEVTGDQEGEREELEELREAFALLGEGGGFSSHDSLALEPECSPKSGPISPFSLPLARVAQGEGAERAVTRP